MEPEDSSILQTVYQEVLEKHDAMVEGFAKEENSPARRELFVAWLIGGLMQHLQEVVDDKQRYGVDGLGEFRNYAFELKDELATVISQLGR